MLALGGSALLAAGVVLGWWACGRRPAATPVLASVGGSAEHLRQIFQHATDGLFLIEVVGPRCFRNLTVNPALLQSMGMRADELVGRLVHETAVPSVAARFIERYERCVQSGDVQREQMAIGLPGGYRVVEMTLVPLRDAGGRIHQLVGIAHDLTERVALEAALSARERVFRTLVENSPDLIVRYDRECRRVYVNPAFARMHEQPAERLLGKTPADDPVLGHGAAAWVMSAIQSVIASGKTRQVSGILRKSNEQWREGDVLLVPEMDGEGRVQTVLGLGRDVTTQRRQQAELERARAQLRELTAIRISHELHEELGQVLTALRLATGMLRVQYAEALPPLLAASNAMTGLVDRAIGTLRELVGRLRPAALDEGLVAALNWLAQDLRQRHSLECSLDIEAAPELGAEAVAALFGIAQEALCNSARHAGTGRAGLRLGRACERWELVVCDAGRGFDPEAVGTRAYGLQVMEKGARLLGGDLRILSCPGVGTEVRLSFPALPGPLEGGHPSKKKS